MNITDIRIRKTYTENRLRALVSITVDYDLASRKDENGSFRDIAHPITPQARKQLEDAVLGAYEQYLAQQPASPEADSGNLLQTARQTALWEQNLYNAPDITYLD